jgi:hypothetical protein
LLRVLTERAEYAAKAARAVAKDPVEGALLVSARIAERKEIRAKRTRGGGFMPWPPCPYEADQSWEQHLHELIGAPWPCDAVAEFWELWDEVLRPFQEAEVQLGRGAFAGWGDGEPGFTRAVWCLTRHLRPDKVIETGVARGITSRFILEALERNGHGHLWSIDLPPLLHPALGDQVGAAVPDSSRHRWTYVRGSSRRRLPSLLAELGQIDLFFHDSRHSERNVSFELEQAMAHLRPGGLALADDIDLNCAWHTVARGVAPEDSIVCLAEPLRPDPGRQDDRGVFGAIRKTREQ